MAGVVRRQSDCSDHSWNVASEGSVQVIFNNPRCSGKLPESRKQIRSGIFRGEVFSLKTETDHLEKAKIILRSRRESITTQKMDCSKAKIRHLETLKPAAAWAQLTNYLDRPTLRQQAWGGVS